MQLNPEQETAANHLDGPCLCTAVPGSGKTRVIVERTARMIQKGVDPKSLLCITFTNKAANEMKERVEKRIGEAATKDIFIATFHRLCSTILRSKHGKNIGYDRAMTILDEDDQVSLMLQTARQLEFELTKPEVKSIVWQTNDWRENLGDDDDLYERFEKLEKEDWYRIAAEYILLYYQPQIGLPNQINSIVIRKRVRPRGRRDHVAYQ
jgi:DNA helicase-2/ATP-dependent DNA helicase PcrA